MSDSFKEATRISSNCFTRDRKLSFTDTMVFILRSAYKTLSVEIDQFFQQISVDQSPPSKQAVSKARMKIKHTGFKEINDLILEEYYSEPYKTYKGYRLLAADGSSMQLPSGDSITEAFGKMKHQSDSFNSGHSLTVYDVLNNMLIDSKLNDYGRSERTYLIDQLETMKKEGKQKKDIIIADRGFPSISIFVRMKQAGYDFVIRYTGKHYLSELFGFDHSDAVDEIVEISLKALGKRQAGGELAKLLASGCEDTIKVRVVKIQLKSGETEYLVTSILDKDVLSIQDLEKIYGLRWGIEEEFKTLKHTMEIENFSAKTEETVLQEYHSKIVIYNLHSTLVQEAQKQLDEKVRTNPKMKYESYQINQNVSYGLVRHRIIELFSQHGGDWEKAYDYLIKAVQRNPIPIKPDRSYPRNHKHSLRFPINRRRAV